VDHHTAGARPPSPRRGTVASLLSILTLVTVGTALPASAQTAFGGDVTIASRYHWRGLTRHDGWVLQPQAYATRVFRRARVSAGAWSVIELAEADATGFGLGRRWFGEVSPWIEATVSVSDLDLTGGWTAYLFDDDARLSTSADDTHEFYLRLTTTELPVVVPRVALWYDADAVDGAYLETGLAVRVPLWGAVILPVGSLILNGDLGWSLGQEDDPDEPGPQGYFADRGLTHVDLSAGIASGMVPVGIFDSWVRAEIHHQLNRDSRTELVGAARSHRSTTWVSFTLSFLAPRCRPEREICS
jgi:hypothetical protein